MKIKRTVCSVLSLVLLCSMLSVGLSGCTGSAKSLWQEAFADAGSGFESAAAIQSATLLLDGEESRDFQATAAEHDVKYLFRSADATRVAHLADGYCLTLPSTEVTVDSSLGEYKTVYDGEDYRLTVSYEDKSPYGNTASGWNTYLTEWLNRFIANDSFLKANDLSRTREVTESTDLIDGYTVLIYDIVIDNIDTLTMPYYQIAIVRQSNVYDAFYLLNMKSTEDRTDAFETMLRSFTAIEAVGTPVSTVGQYEVEIPEYWSDETRAYYESMLAKIDTSATDWGFFTHSMPSKSEGHYRSTRLNMKSRISFIESEDGIDSTEQIMPTYLHLGYGSSLLDFPLDLANEFAGGNGINGKPVLQVSYQFTLTNNTNLDGATPMYDILRGKYDDHFRAIAQDIKAYGKPVLFRLNNEMNSDWTSYCGMVTLLDPELFIAAWQRMYDIFIEEGVDNTIWIFNPISKSCPYSNWGEAICYMPGSAYTQALGLTSYQMGNSLPMASFEEMYSELYEQNAPYFASWPMVVGEFACGSGGDSSGLILGRNENLRAAWVEAMFDCLSHKGEAGYEFCSNIVAMVWFDCNDGGDNNTIMNYLKIPTDATATWKALREGLAKINGTSSE